LGILITSTRLTAQVNLVLNPSFEDTIECIYTGSQLGHLYHWSSPTNATPDAFSVDYCDVYLNSDIIAVPSNYWGYQQPRTGNNYAGFYFLLDNDYPDREYIQVHLSEKLKPNIVYCVKYYVSMCDAQSCLAIRGFEAYFSTDSIYVEGSPPVFPILTLPAQISVDTLVSDSINWVEISGYFMAQGDEEYMLIGNFKPQNQVQRIIINDDLLNKGAYYYIDDVSVFECDSTVGIEENGINNKFKIYPNPANEQILIEYKLNTPTDFKLTLYDVLGNVVYQELRVKAYGSYSINIPITNLTSGIYITQIELNAKRVSKKLIKM
jgi:OOP family OmpA-OmpF porin